MTSLWPIELRARTIFAFVCIWSLRDKEQPMLAMLPRDVIRQICGWVRADFTQKLMIGTTEFRLVFYSQRFYWKSVNGYYNACGECLRFLYHCSAIPKSFIHCIHRDNWYEPHNIKKLQTKYILP